MTKQNKQLTRRIGALAGAVIMAVATMGAASAAAVDKTPAQVTSGDFASFAAAEGAEVAISGHAQMVRRANGTTKVSIHVTGLEPGHTYGSHVHAAPCAIGDADGHYNFGHPVSGGVGPGDAEIWPGPVVANGGGVANGNATVGETAGATAVSVVIHRSSGEKIACADLS